MEIIKKRKEDQGVASSIRLPAKPFKPDHVRIAAKRVDLPANVVASIAAGYADPMRNRFNVQALLAYDSEESRRFKSMLLEIAAMYQTREAVPPGILNECVRVVVNHYLHLSQNELLLAFRLKDNGLFTAPGGEAYGGMFSSGTLSKVLYHYNQFRRKVVAEMQELREQEYRERKKQAVVEKRRQRFEEVFPDQIRAFSMKKDDDGVFEHGWQHVPAWWYDAALKRDMFDGKLTRAYKLKIWEEAKELSSLSEEEGSAFSLDKIAQKNKDRAVVIAQKIICFRLLVLPLREEHKRNTKI